MNKKTKYTLLLVPDDGRPVKKYSLTRLKTWTAAAIGIAAAGLIVFNASLFGSYLFDKDIGLFDIRNLKSENEELRLERSVEVGLLESKLMELSSRFNDVSGKMFEIETITGFRDFDAKLLMSAKGGPQKIAANNVKNEMSLLEQDISGLGEQSQKMEDRLKKIMVFVRANEERLKYSPAGWPVRGWISSSYGWRRDPMNNKRSFHDGIDISAWHGTPIKATANGKITQSGTNGGYGKVVMISHKYGYKTIYGHMSRIIVNKGQSVKRGDIIGYVGNTGRATGAHVHYEMRVNDKAVNPWPYLGLNPQ